MQDIQSQQPYKVSLTILVGLLLVGLYTEQFYWLYTAAFMGCCVVLSSTFNKYLVHLWMLLTKVLSMVMPKLILGMIYLAFITPLALLYRLFRKPSDFTFKRATASQFTAVQKTFPAPTFEKMW